MPPRPSSTAPGPTTRCSATTISHISPSWSGPACAGSSRGRRSTSSSWRSTSGRWPVRHGCENGPRELEEPSEEEPMAVDLIEALSEMTDDYLKELKHTLVVSGDTELISAPAYYLAATRAPSINAFMTGISIIQDELAHAHIAYHILEELGDDQEKLIFSRDPKSFRYPYAFDVPLDSWTELV